MKVTGDDLSIIHIDLSAFDIPKGIIVENLNFDKRHVPGVAVHISNAKNSGNPIEYFDQNPTYTNILLIDVYNLYERELKQRASE